MHASSSDWHLHVLWQRMGRRESEVKEVCVGHSITQSTEIIFSATQEQEQSIDDNGYLSRKPHSIIGAGREFGTVGLRL
jgi:hypothetical protein